MSDLSKLREDMVENQIAARGIRSEAVLGALRKVPREAFLPERLREFAYEDSPLPIAAGQTISQPYIVALMTEALDLQGGERVLEIGTGSGYAAAVLAEIAAEVYTVERIGELAEKAASTLEALGYRNVHVVHGDGTLGWAAAAPYDAIIVAAGGPEVPQSLKQQLKVGGRLVIPVGTDPRAQELVRVTRISNEEFKSEDIADVRFVPLVGKEGWAPAELPFPSKPRPARLRSDESDIVNAITAFCRALQLDRSGGPRRAAGADRRRENRAARRSEPRHLRILPHARAHLAGADNAQGVSLCRHRRGLARRGASRPLCAAFRISAERVDGVRPLPDLDVAQQRGAVVRGLAARPQCGARRRSERVAIYGLDLYSLYTSIGSVLKYLDEVDPDSARIARQRYGCLTPWQADPATYGHAALTGAYRTCEKEVVRMLEDILHKQSDYAAHDGERFMDAVQNARLVTDAERYYRIMYYGSRASWNLRDNHMFETLKTLLDFHGPRAKAIVWAHNSHVGDAAATEMSARGEYNIGHLCREEFGNGAYSIGFGTHAGTVAAASDWDGPMEVKAVLPSLKQSYERLCHETGRPQFMLPLRGRSVGEVRNRLAKPRLERAIGVIYRPETELASHYFQAVLPAQFDEYIWFDETRAVTPFETKELEGLPDTYPFGL